MQFIASLSVWQANRLGCGLLDAILHTKIINLSIHTVAISSIGLCVGGTSALNAPPTLFSEQLAQAR